MERVALVVTAVASLWFVLANCWEIGGPLGGGHWAAEAAVGTAAENMLRWKILQPVLIFTQDAPPPSLYYCNHPWGIFWQMVPFVKIFGHHTWVVRLPAVLMSAFTPALLYGIGRGIWSPVAGAVAAASFVVVPVALAFGNFNGLEIPTIFGVLLAIWAYVRLSKNWRRRWVALSALGCFIAVNTEWTAYFFFAPVLAFMLPRGILWAGRWYPAVDRRRFAQLWALFASICVGVFVFYLWQFQKADQLGNLLTQGIRRSYGADLPLEAVLQQRAHWIELSFTPLAIFVGKLMVPVLLFRFVLLRRDLELFPLAVLTMATLHYLVFKQGADIHFFWSHYFAPYFALAMGVFAATLEGLGRFIARRFGRQGMLVPPIVALALALIVPVMMIPDGVRGLVYSRRTEGRFDERGDLIHQDVDKTAALTWFKGKLESNTGVGFHEGMFAGWQTDWLLRRPTGTGPVPTTPSTGYAQYYVLDSRFILASDLSTLVKSFHVRVVGPFYMVDRGEPKAPLDGFSIDEREPTFFEWYFRQGVDPIYRVVPDPFVTWEQRYVFAQTPNPPPTTVPTSFEQRRIAVNLAVANGDVALADRLRSELEAELDKSTAQSWPDGTRLLGSRVTHGVVTKLGLYFMAAGPIDPDVWFSITSRVTARAKWSLVAAPERVRGVGMPFDLPTPLWKKGMIYRSLTEIRPRPGTEEFDGRWESRRGKATLPGHEPVRVLTVGG